MLTLVHGLTKQQSAALLYIGAFVAARGYAPTYAEICAGLGMSAKSRSNLTARIQRLRDRGYLKSQDRYRQQIALSELGIRYVKKHSAPALRGVASAPSKPSSPVRPAVPGLRIKGQGEQAGQNSHGGAT